MNYQQERNLTIKGVTQLGKFPDEVGQKLFTLLKYLSFYKYNKDNFER